MKKIKFVIEFSSPISDSLLKFVCNSVSEKGAKQKFRRLWGGTKDGYTIIDIFNKGEI